MVSTSHLAGQLLRKQISYHLDNEDVSTAAMLAGRLQALEPRNPDSWHLLALTHYRLRRYHEAHDFADKYGGNGRHLGCAYIYALACLELGRFKEGATALERSRSHWLEKNDWTQVAENGKQYLPDAPAVWTLMGKLWQKYGQLKIAGECFMNAHKANLFAWDAFEGLCKLGGDLNIEQMFKPCPEMLNGIALGVGMGKSGAVKDVSKDDAQYSTTQGKSGGGFFTTPSSDPFVSSHAGNNASHFGFPRLKDKTAQPHFLRGHSNLGTPTANGDVYQDDSTMSGIMYDDETIQTQPLAAQAQRGQTGQSLAPGARAHPSTLRGRPLSGSDTSHDNDPSAVLQGPAGGGHKRPISSVGSHLVDNGSSDSAVQPTRRSNRLGTQSTVSTRSHRQPVNTAVSISGTNERTARPARPATGARGRTGAQVGRVVSGNRSIKPPDPAEKEKERTNRAPSRNSDKNASAPTMANNAESKTHRPPAQQQHTQAEFLAQQSQQQFQALEDLCVNMRTLAVGHFALHRFHLHISIATLKNLPAAQRETPWVLATLAKAYYENNSYKEAEACFSKLLRLQPNRIEDMEIYSTVLWHLKKETALATLCRALADVWYLAPQTWCCVGNAFSLNRDHDNAITAFKRATILDNRFTYAWTLMGHEYIANEEFDEALSCFRRAVHIERRFFGGWYGLGKCYERMGRFEDAEMHYRIASQLNPSSSTLVVCIGIVLEAMKHHKAALVCYNRALDITHTSELARFRKARTLMSLKLFDEALIELNVLKIQAPDEANIWFILGKCYKALGDPGQALKAMTTALNLDVKAAPFIKEAMEALDQPYDSEID